MPRDVAADKDILAMAFVNSQKITSVYDIDTGFTCGTIYPALNKPLSTGGAWR
ncbi:MAG: spore coat associated protein CotJA [Clostridia bacterium]|nr:spore coat associated protein CotJA [Clostridia bacterium]MBR4116522.1 spore coat associated protein CotJA [Clostridia bacterium]